MAQQKVDMRWLSGTGGPSRLKPATSVTQYGQKYLVLKINVAGHLNTHLILQDEVGKWACDHDGPVSDCGRCADCGVPLLK